MCRNVAPGRFQRCMESLEQQDCEQWGAVLFDDASDDTGAREYQQFYLQNILPAKFKGKVKDALWRTLGQLGCEMLQGTNARPHSFSKE